MSWQALLTSQRIRTHITSRQELDDLRDVVERDLADAAIASLSADRRFATAYNAALQTAKDFQQLTENGISQAYPALKKT